MIGQFLSRVFHCSFTYKVSLDFMAVPLVVTEVVGKLPRDKAPEVDESCLEVQMALDLV